MSTMAGPEPSHPPRAADHGRFARSVTSRIMKNADDLFGAILRRHVGRFESRSVLFGYVPYLFDHVIVADSKQTGRKKLTLAMALTAVHLKVHPHGVPLPSRPADRSVRR